MHKCAFIIFAATISAISPNLRACDCCDHGSGIVHFKDGLTPNGPVDTSYSRGDIEATAGYTYRDYGPVRVVPPAPAPPKPTS